MKLLSFVGTIVLISIASKDTATKVGLLISYYTVLSFRAAQNLIMSLVPPQYRRSDQENRRCGHEFHILSHGGCDRAAGPPGLECAEIFRRLRHAYTLLCSLGTTNNHILEVVSQEAESGEG